MFEENENLVSENTENVEEQTTEEIADGTTETTEETKTEETPVKTYTEKEMNARVDELLAKKLGSKLFNQERKLRKEFEEQLASYKEAESVLNAGLGTSNITEATNQMRDFYTKKGVNIPKYVPSYNEYDMEAGAEKEANSIIASGYDEVIEEVDRLANKERTARENLIFLKLAEYRKVEGNRKELASIGVKDDVIESKDFKDFASQFNSNTPITKVYALYTKTLDKPPVEKIGSLKNGDGKEEKTFYTPDEVDKLTREQLRDPNIFKRVRESMTKWK